MNQNDKFHNGTAPELNKEQLESVAGGASKAIEEDIKWENLHCDTCEKTTLHSFQRIREDNP